MGDTGTPIILIVEDNEDDVTALRRQISKLWSDGNIIHVDSLSEAYLNFRKYDFSVVLLDLNLPDGHGARTVSEMRKFNRSVPIVVMTGNLNDQIFDEAIKGGATYVISKGQVDSDGFLDILRKILTPHIRL